MQELVNNFLDALSNILPGLETSIKLGLFGAIVIFALFLIALAISAGSKITKYRKQLISSAKFLNGQPTVDENNVEAVYAELKKHPDEVQTGWSRFMDQRIGFPSDYIAEKNVLSKKEFSGNGTVGKIFLGVLGAIVWAVIGLIGFMSDVEAETVMQAVIALEFIIIPVAVYIICFLLIDIVYNRQIRRLQLAFTSFCELLDAKVVVSDREEREFVSDNLSEINRRVDELIKGRLTDEEVIEVVTAPKIAKTEELGETEKSSAEPVAEEMPAAPAAAVESETEETPAAVEETAPERIEDMSAEQKSNYFSVLLEVVERAVNDATLGDDDYAEIAAAINDEAIKSGAYENPDDKAIFDDCFVKLAEKLNA